MARLAVLGCAVAFALGCLSFRRTLSFDQFALDDVKSVNSSCINGTLPVSEIWRRDFWCNRIDTESSHGSYRPLTTLSFWIQAGPGEHYRWHAANVLLHASCAAVLVPLGVALGAKPLAAAVAGALFAVHPVHTESVANLTGRADVLGTLCFCLGMIAYCALTRARSLILRAALCTLIVAAAGAGMLFKETALLLIPLVTAAHLYRELLCTSGRLSKMLLAGLGVAAAVLLKLRTTVSGGRGLTRLAFSYMDNPLLFEPDRTVRALTAAQYTLKYLQLLVWPHSLAYDFSFPSVPLVRSWEDPRNALAGALLAGGLVFTLWCHIRGQHLTVLLMAWLVGTLLPGTSLLYPVGTVVAERLLYLPSAAFCLIAAQPLAEALLRAPTLVRSVLTGGLCTLLALGCAGCHVQSASWASDLALHLTHTRSNPYSSKVLYNAGFSLGGAGRAAEGLQCHEQGYLLNPDDLENNMALATRLLPQQPLRALQIFNRTYHMQPLHKVQLRRLLAARQHIDGLRLEMGLVPPPGLSEEHRRAGEHLARIQTLLGSSQFGAALEAAQQGVQVFGGLQAMEELRRCTQRASTLGECAEERRAPGVRMLFHVATVHLMAGQLVQGEAGLDALLEAGLESERAYSNRVFGCRQRKDDACVEAFMRRFEAFEAKAFQEGLPTNS